jgi:SAM-dependent methyltransferase
MSSGASVPRVPTQPADVTVHRVDPVGIVVSSRGDHVVDVNFDGRRVWSFWVLRDSEPAGNLDRGRRLAAWPPRLMPFLDGHTRLTIRTHVDEHVLYDEELTFGDSEQRIQVVDAEGHPLGMDKSGRLERTFETRTAAQVTPLLDSIETVIRALGEAGVEAFPAYGTLLGAVRGGTLIGHDSDADLAYVSKRTTPVDVIRESFQLQRRLAELGFRCRRYSGAGFKVIVTEADGSSRGLDVFGGFFSDGHLIVLGEIRVPYEESWLWPLGTTVLEGRTLPAPADAERFLTATYGPNWRVPDPAFEFTTPRATYARLNDWFRGSVVNRADWDRSYTPRVNNPLPERPSALARLIADSEQPGLVVDVGCGRGRSASWLAERGIRAMGLDYSPPAFAHAAHMAREQGLPLSFANMNLMELRHVLGYGARLARLEGPRIVMGRHIADALDERGRQHLWRFAAMVCGPDGKLYLEFLTEAAPDDMWASRRLITPLSPEVVESEVAAFGGSVVARDEASMGPTADERAPERRGIRLVIAWQR